MFEGEEASGEVNEKATEVRVGMVRKEPARRVFMTIDAGADVSVLPEEFKSLGQEDKGERRTRDHHEGCPRWHHQPQWKKEGDCCVERSGQRAVGSR